jgi:hypothetical protein
MQLAAKGPFLFSIDLYSSLRYIFSALALSHYFLQKNFKKTGSDFLMTIPFQYALLGFLLKKFVRNSSVLRLKLVMPAILFNSPCQQIY